MATAKAVKVAMCSEKRVVSVTHLVFRKVSNRAPRNSWAWFSKAKLTFDCWSLGRSTLQLLSPKGTAAHSRTCLHTSGDPQTAEARQTGWTADIYSLSSTSTPCSMLAKITRPPQSSALTARCPPSQLCPSPWQYPASAVQLVHLLQWK